MPSFRSIFPVRGSSNRQGDRNHATSDAANAPVFDVRGNPLRKGGDRHHLFPDRVRNMVVVLFGEFCGTYMFLLLSFIGAQTALDTNSPGNPSAPLLPFSLMYIAASFGAALAINVWIFYRVTGGMFNPAVSSP